MCVTSANRSPALLSRTQFPSPHHTARTTAYGRNGNGPHQSSWSMSRPCTQCTPTTLPRAPEDSRAALEQPSARFTSRPRGTPPALPVVWPMPLHHSLAYSLSHTRELARVMRVTSPNRSPARIACPEFRFTPSHRTHDTIWSLSSLLSTPHARQHI